MISQVLEVVGQGLTCLTAMAALIRHLKVKPREADDGREEN